MLVGLVFEGVVVGLLLLVVIMCWRVDCCFNVFKMGQDGVCEFVIQFNDVIDCVCVVLVMLECVSWENGEIFECCVQDVCVLFDELCLMIGKVDCMVDIMFWCLVCKCVVDIFLQGVGFLVFNDFKDVR